MLGRDGDDRIIQRLELPSYLRKHVVEISLQFARFRTKQTGENTADLVMRNFACCLVNLRNRMLVEGDEHKSR